MIPLELLLYEIAKFLRQSIMSSKTPPLTLLFSWAIMVLALHGCTGQVIAQSVGFWGDNDPKLILEWVINRAPPNIRVTPKSKHHEKQTPLLAKKKKKPLGPQKVAILDDTGSAGAHVFTGIFKKSPYRAHYLTGRDIRNGALKGFKLLILPAGDAALQSKALSQSGKQKIVRYVKKGGGYLGICAGAYLGMYWFVPHAQLSAGKGKGYGGKTISMWNRGVGPVKMSLLPKGVQLFGRSLKQARVHFQNGPIIKRLSSSKNSNFAILARYDTELAYFPVQRGTMAKTPAMVKTTYGKGRVILMSPHPEFTEGLEWMILKALDHLRAKTAISK